MCVTKNKITEIKGIWCPHTPKMSVPFDPIPTNRTRRTVQKVHKVTLGHYEELTVSIPGGHGDDPVDLGFSHGTDHRFYGQGVSCHSWEDRGWETEAGHDHILSFEMRLQTVCWENVSFYHLEAADKETYNNKIVDRYSTTRGGMYDIYSFSLLFNYLLNHWVKMLRSV